MNVSAEQVKSKKIIGKSGNQDVVELTLKGGFVMVVKMNASGSGEALGLGSHRGISRYIAKKKCPDLQFTELSKSEEIEPSLFMQYVPYWEKATDDLIAKQKK